MLTRYADEFCSHNEKDGSFFKILQGLIGVP